MIFISLKGFSHIISTFHCVTRFYTIPRPRVNKLVFTEKYANMLHTYRPEKKKYSQFVDG